MPEVLNKRFFQKIGKPKYGSIATQIPKIKSIRSLRIYILYQKQRINAKMSVNVNRL